MSKLLIAYHETQGPCFIENKDGTVSRLPKQDGRIFLDSRMACRHGLVAGATGTGKTITLKVLTEAFAGIGVPVIVTDVKGDISGLAAKGNEDDNLYERAKSLGVTDYHPQAAPNVTFYDPFARKDTKMTKVAPLPLYRLSSDLLARLLGLTKAQSGVLDIVYRVCEDNRVRMDTLDDLKWMINYVQSHKAALSQKYGYVPASSTSVVLRSILRLEAEGGTKIFGEERDDKWALIPQVGQKPDNKQTIKILNCTELAYKPLLYSAYLLWMLDQINEVYPEVGDLDKPRLVLIFDEAHLIFNDAEKVLLQKIEQTVKLIRSKGVSIWFCTQAPTDIPDGVLAQLGNRIQHALRAYTPSEQKKVKAAAQSFRPNPAFKTAEVITEMGIGEALVSFLDEQGVPQMVQQASIIPPECAMGAFGEAKVA